MNRKIQGSLGKLMVTMSICYANMKQKPCGFCEAAVLPP